MQLLLMTPINLNVFSKKVMSTWKFLMAVSNIQMMWYVRNSLSPDWGSAELFHSCGKNYSIEKNPVDTIV